MERSEPTLVPEWLRNTGNITGGGTSNHHFPSSSSHSDASSRNRTSKTTGDFDTTRSAFLDRTSSSNSRRSSSNGSVKHAYSSFNRGHRDKEREKEKERLSFVDHWDRDSPDPLGKILPNRIDKDVLRRSHSMVSRRQGELFHRRGAADAKASVNSNHNNGNGMTSGSAAGSSIQKAVFEKDFPSLGSEEKQGVTDIGRVSSPGLSSPVQSLPIGNSSLIGGEGWTSALAEVPNMIGSSGTGASTFQQIVPATTTSGPSNVTAGLNMAEALVQAPSRARAAPQVSELSVKSQRLEELAIKQSRQLIPVTPSMPKALTLNSSDKSKLKLASRTGELNVAIKGGQPQSLSVHHTNQSRSGHIKSDAQKSSHGKFLVLKPVRENGVSIMTKDVSSAPASNANSMVTTSQFALAPSAVHASLRSPNNSNLSSMERKIASLDIKSGSNVEKRPSLSQVQSRNDFFNLIKKKTSMSSSSVLLDSCPGVKSPTVGESNELSREDTNIPARPCIIENGAEETRNCDSSEDVRAFPDNSDKAISSFAAESPDEEEAAFLRSLGWDENCGEEGLTEEEINSFIREHIKREPSLKMGRFMPLKILVRSQSHGDSKYASDSELSSSDSEA